MRLLTGICAVVLGTILVAGLWPFRAPQNEVSWLGQNKGVLFGKHGSMVSAGPLRSRAPQGDNSCSIEIWLKPNRIDSSGMMLAFYWPEHRVVPFALRQFRDGIVLALARSRFDEKSEMYVGDVFRIQKSVLVTITSGRAGTAAYVDGTLVKDVPSFTFSNRDLTGEFVVGDAPSKTYSWSGQLKGFAVYDRELSATEVSQSFMDWTKSAQRDSLKSEDLVARYLFDEGHGNVAHNQVDSAPDLLIPERLPVLNKQFLQSPWDEFRPTWSYWENAGVNVAGFIPLGFFFYAYFSQLLAFRNSTVITIVVGFTVSLTIEVLQGFLPTRDSGMTDLITNTLGVALGVALCRWSMRHKCFARVGASSTPSSTDLGNLSATLNGWVRMSKSSEHL